MKFLQHCFALGLAQAFDFCMHCLAVGAKARLVFR